MAGFVTALHTINRVQALATKCQTDKNLDPHEVCKGFMNELEEAIKLPINQHEYLTALRGKVRLSATVHDIVEPALPDKHIVPGHAERLSFLKAVEHGLDARIEALD